MRNFGMSDFDRDAREAPSDLADPVVTAQRGESLGDGLQGLGSHVDRVGSLVQIVDNDGAGFESHHGNLSYSSFVRLLDRGKTQGRRRMSLALSRARVLSATFNSIRKDQLPGPCKEI